jgi:hypothetical protein
MESTTLSTPDAAAYVGLATETLIKYRYRGVGPAFIRLGRRVLYRPRDLDAWLEENVVDPGAPGRRERARLARQAAVYRRNRQESTQPVP